MEVSVTSRPFRKLWQTDRPTDKQMYMKGHREVTLPIRKQWMTTLLVLDNGSYSSSSKMSLQVQCKHVQRWRITKRGESYISMLLSEHLFTYVVIIIIKFWLYWLSKDKDKARLWWTEAGVLIHTVILDIFLVVAKLAAHHDGVRQVPRVVTDGRAPDYHVAPDT